MKRKRLGAGFFGVRRGLGLGELSVDLDDVHLRGAPSQTSQDSRPGGPISGDYDTPQTLTMDQNQRMPSHEGGSDELLDGNIPEAQAGPGALDAERGVSLKELDRGRDVGPIGPYADWTGSTYTDSNQFEGGTGIHLGARDLDDAIAEAERLSAEASDRSSHDAAMKAFDAAARLAEHEREPDLADELKGRAHDHWKAKKAGRALKFAVGDWVLVTPVQGKPYKAQVERVRDPTDHDDPPGGFPTLATTYHVRMPGRQSLVELEDHSDINPWPYRNPRPATGWTQSAWSSVRGSPDVASVVPTTPPATRKKTQAQAQRAPWLAVDLDGTLLAHEPGMAERGQFGTPLPGAVKAMRELKSLGWKVSVFTARLSELEEHEAQAMANQIAQVLHQNGIPFDDVWIGRKPKADYFVDDKAIHFGGDWDSVLLQLTQVGGETQPDLEAPMDKDGMPGLMGGGDLMDLDTPGSTRSDLSIQRPPDREELWY